jgi:hypothetical protein
MSVAKHNVPSSQAVSPLCVGCDSCFGVSRSATWWREPLRGREVHWHSRLSQLITSNAAGVTMSQSDVTPTAVSARRPRAAQTRYQYVAPCKTAYMKHTARERNVSSGRWIWATNTTDRHTSGIFWLHGSHSHRIKGFLPCKRNKISFPHHSETWSQLLQPPHQPRIYGRTLTCAKRKSTSLGPPKAQLGLMPNPYTLNRDFRLRCFSILAAALNVVAIRSCAASCTKSFGVSRVNTIFYRTLGKDRY